MSLAVVALSGGMDSCVAASMARQDGHELALLHAGYGQLTEARERLAFEQLADHFGAPPHRRLMAPMPAIKLIGGSALTDSAIPLDKGDWGRAGSGGPPNSYVPFRNAHLLAACVSWAEAIKAEQVIVGFVERDSSGYPDCTKSFLAAFERAASIGTGPSTNIKIGAPVIDKAKAEIIEIGMSLGAPLHLTWSCYQSGALACGACDSCLLRLRGFERAGYKDPIPYSLHGE